MATTMIIKVPFPLSSDVKSVNVDGVGFSDGDAIGFDDGDIVGTDVVVKGLAVGLGVGDKVNGEGTVEGQ